MRKLKLIFLLAPLATGGCATKLAWNVATLPVKGAVKVVDWTTTSQSEADRNKGRAMRKAGYERRQDREARLATRDEYGDDDSRSDR